MTPDRSAIPHSGDVVKMSRNSNTLDQVVRMVELRQAGNINPVCPHCSAEVGAVLFQELRGFLGKRFIYFCSECRAVLGVSHRKGFWMG
jgi:hypothetical protein